MPLGLNAIHRHRYADAPIITYHDVEFELHRRLLGRAKGKFSTYSPGSQYDADTRA